MKRRKYNEDLDFKVVDDDGETIAVLGAERIPALSSSTLAWQAEVTAVSPIIVLYHTSALLLSSSPPLQVYTNTKMADIWKCNKCMILHLSL